VLAKLTFITFFRTGCHDEIPQLCDGSYMQWSLRMPD
jgi:hypothetical protein